MSDSKVRDSEHRHRKKTPTLSSRNKRMLLFRTLPVWSYEMTTTPTHEHLQGSPSSLAEGSGGQTAVEGKHDGLISFQAVHSMWNGHHMVVATQPALLCTFLERSNLNKIVYICSLTHPWRSPWYSDGKKYACMYDMLCVQCMDVKAFSHMNPCLNEKYWLSCNKNTKIRPENPPKNTPCLKHAWNSLTNIKKCFFS